MKTLLERIKVVIQNDSDLRVYIREVKVCSPNLLPDIPSSLVPYIGIAPVNSSEVWFSNLKKRVIHTVRIMIVDLMEIQENSILGNSNKKGVTEIVEDIDDALRGRFFSEGGVHYLSKPSDITDVTYAEAGQGDQFYLFVASVTLQCERIFDTTVQE